MPCRLHGYPCFRFSVWAKTGEKQKYHKDAGLWILLVIPHYVVQPDRPSEWRPFRLSVAKPEPKKSWRRVRANFNWVSKVIHGWIGFASLRSVTDLENSRQSLNQSNAKLKSIATCGNPRFPALQGVCVFVLFWSALVITRVFPRGPPTFPPPEPVQWHLLVTFSVRIMYFMYIH